MPISKYNSLFGGNAQEAYNNMISEYGRKHGKEVFYASVNKRKKKRKNVIGERANGS